MEKLSTLCYIEEDGKYLMLHRVIKEHDVNHGKWIGVGGHFKEGESPDECLLREVKEETGLGLISYRIRGIITFISGKGLTEYMFLYTANAWEGKQRECDEGILTWIDKEDIANLTLWEGDRIFLKLIADDTDFFSLKLVYDYDNNLIKAVLDGRTILHKI